MSKIALTPNASGTGTFTIAAPNSNTNRTLTLPDSTGELYGQGNILGTVSESSGVPTGAIIESGSNANGQFVRYADGTMICEVIDIGNLTSTTATGNMFCSSSYSTWTFPSAFIGVPAISGSSQQATNENRWVVIATHAATSCQYRQVTPGSSATARGTNLIAKGRWF
jgi:hypothetical protein